MRGYVSHVRYEHEQSHWVPFWYGFTGLARFFERLPAPLTILSSLSAVQLFRLENNDKTVGSACFLRGYLLLFSIFSPLFAAQLFRLTFNVKNVFFLLAKTPPTLSRCVWLSGTLSLSTLLSPACMQRGSGLAQWRLPINVMRRTALSSLHCRCCGLQPPLRQTACWVLAFDYFYCFLYLTPLLCG